MMGLIECLGIHMAHFGVGQVLVDFYMLYLCLYLCFECFLVHFGFIKASRNSTFCNS